jgi:hypothetical protein
MFVLGFWLVDLHMGGVLTFVVFSCPLKTSFFLGHVSYTILNFFAFNKCEVFRPFRLFMKSCETFLLKETHVTLKKNCKERESGT